MRVIEEIAHPACKITIFHWNAKYLVKFENGNLEQTFKIDESEVNGVGELKKILTHEFITAVYKRFLEMNANWKEEFTKLKS